MFAETTIRGQRVAQLSAVLERWTAEYPAILAIDPERARHHLAGIVDLQSLIDHLEARDASASEYAQFQTRSVPSALGA
jgi:hypothetical protein